MLDPDFDQLPLCIVVLTTVAAIAVMLWPLDERPMPRGLLRWWRR